MIERILQEIQFLQGYNGALECDPNGGWVLFKEFKLPAGWNREVTELLIIIRSGYPTTPPDNFFVPTGFGLVTGVSIGNYSESVEHLGRKWGQFSYHVEDGGWRPTSEISNGDNLLTFMLKVSARLNEVN